MGQMLPAVLLLESLNLLQFLTPDVQLRGTCPSPPKFFTFRFVQQRHWCLHYHIT
ncbi:MAG: hypothetical protein V7L23_18810 [Nostoc sp.]